MSATTQPRTVGAIVYFTIAALVVGGLGWVTAAALRLEMSDRMRLALWRLDGRVAPALAREDSRPYHHYDPLYVPIPAVDRTTLKAVPQGGVLVPSPLLNAELPNWLSLHFQCFETGTWRSPQVPPAALLKLLRNDDLVLDLGNVTPRRAELLGQLELQQPPTQFYQRLTESSKQPNSTEAMQQQVEQQWGQGAPPLFSQQPDNDLVNRGRQQVVTKQEGRGSFSNNSLSYPLAPIGEAIPWEEIGGKWSAANLYACTVRLDPLTPLWLRTDGQPDRLVIARLARSGGRRVVQGVLLDWDRLQEVLKEPIADLFPDARFLPLGDEPDQPDRVMTALPIQLDPGPLTASVLPGWSPLRTGLSLAWAAALLGLTVVGLWGWSLLDLSERRIQFVSAVTHELRTPLTTLRLYLDMLTSGLVRDETQKTEYLQTLHGESDRLHRLVSNVLDFARLERQRPKLALRPVSLGGLLEQVRDNWQGRCAACGKELIVEVAPGCCSEVTTDPELVQQIVGNLIDNACKYSRSATDGRIWLRARRDGPKAVTLEVEDRGPGVAPGDQRLIFRAFRRGKRADVTAGGVGLGLALAGRWTRLIGGRLSHRPGSDGVGACFQLRLRAV